MAATIAGGGIGGLGAMIICIGKLVYEMKKCQARYGCPNNAVCGEDDICCNLGVEGPPCIGQCCPRLHSCCCGLKCCPPDRTCTSGAVDGVPRAKCCGAPSPGNTMTPCDGECCDHASPFICCPGRSNSCRDPGVGC